VRRGTAASTQLQLDLYCELFDALYQARRIGLEPEPEAWRVGQTLLHFLESAWEKPDDGIWEVRGPRRHFTHSKVMAWVVFDRAVRIAEQFGLDAPFERWKAARDEIHREVCEQGYDARRKTFTQYYGSKELDSSTLNIPLVGF